MSNINTIRVSGTTYQIEDSNASKTVELTQAQYDALVDKDPNTYYIITDAEAGDLTNYYTKSETNTLLGGKADTATTYTKTEVDNAITAATSTKQDTLVSGTNIKTINNESILGSGNIDIQGGGKAIEAGRGISITTGETADTVSFNLPISAGTGSNSIQEGYSTTASGDYGAHAEGEGSKAYGRYGAHAEGSYTVASGNSSHAEGQNAVASGTSSHAEGNDTQANGSYSHAEGIYSQANGSYSHAEGAQTVASGNSSHAEGYNTVAYNDAEHASGRYNVSNSASTTFGDSGNTLFSVGNGTSNSARHNAFEIRQNGDIYIPYAGNDIKLQDKIAEFQSVISDWVQAMIGVEYIQSTDGYQYINLGYVPSGTGVEIGGEVMIVSYPSTAQWMTTAYIAYSGENYEAFRMIRRSNEDGTLYCNHHTKASGQGQAMSMTLGNKYTFKFTDSEYQFGEDTYTNSGGTGTTNTATIKLFGNGSAIGAITRIYSFYIKKDGALVMDLIPVVKNGVGMMYDKISGQFFTNNGTGSFTFPS